MRAKSKKTKFVSSPQDEVVPLLTSKFVREVREEILKYERGELETVSLEDVMREEGMDPDA